jgi:hypothetical protein
VFSSLLLQYTKKYYFGLFVVIVIMVWIISACVFSEDYKPAVGEFPCPPSLPCFPK